MRRASLVCWFLLLLGVPLAAAQDFSQWRGPRRDGTVKFTTPDAWPRAMKKAWQVTVGEGHASPVVIGKTVYAFARQEENEVLLGIDLATGKTRFSEEYGAPYEMNSAAASHGKGPKSTPVVAGDRVVTLGISGILTCRDAATGKRLWQHKFAKEFKSTSPLYGTAMSPLVHEGLCIAHVGGHDSGALTAFEMDSGKPRWKWDKDGPGYTSPVIAKFGDVEQVITQSQDFCLTVAPASGKLLWDLPYTTDYDQNSVTPLVSGERVIFGGYNKPTTAVRVEQAGGTWSAKQEWSNADLPMYMSAPVASGDAFFGMTHRNAGQLFCADLRSGKIHWRGKPRLGENAALLITADVLLALTTGGELLIVKNAADSYQELARYRVADAPTWAHPAVVDGNKVLVKDRTTLALWTLGE